MHKVHKVSLCKSFVKSGDCKYGSRCMFAHSLGELARSSVASELLDRRLPDTVPASDHDGLQLRCANCELPILAAAQIYKLKRGGAWSNAVVPTVRRGKRFKNKEKRCYATKADCAQCGINVGAIYENPYADDSVGPFPRIRFKLAPHPKQRDDAADRLYVAAAPNALETVLVQQDVAERAALPHRAVRTNHAAVMGIEATARALEQLRLDAAQKNDDAADRLHQAEAQAREACGLRHDAEQQIREAEAQAREADGLRRDAEAQRAAAEALLANARAQTPVDGECPICFEDLPLRRLCADQAHAFCVDCIERHVTARTDAEHLGTFEAAGGVVCAAAGCALLWGNYEVGRVSQAANEQVVRTRLTLREREVRLEEQRRADDRVKHAVAAERTTSQHTRLVKAAVQHIQEAILVLRCPRCEAPFNDFVGCFALTCPQCRCGICAWCLNDCGDDAHKHVLDEHNRLHAPIAEFHAAMANLKLAKIEAYLHPKEHNVIEAVVIEIARDLIQQDGMPPDAPEQLLRSVERHVR